MYRNVPHIRAKNTDIFLYDSVSLVRCVLCACMHACVLRTHVTDSSVFFLFHVIKRRTAVLPFIHAYTHAHIHTNKQTNNGTKNEEEEVKKHTSTHIHRSRVIFDHHQPFSLELLLPKPNITNIYI